MDDEVLDRGRETLLCMGVGALAVLVALAALAALLVVADVAVLSALSVEILRDKGGCVGAGSFLGDDTEAAEFSGVDVLDRSVTSSLGASAVLPFFALIPSPTGNFWLVPVAKGLIKVGERALRKST